MIKEIYLNDDLSAGIIQHAKAVLPNECCGYITGVGNVCNTLYPMTNIDASPVHFSFDPMEQFKVVKSARKMGEVPLVVYHSHPESEPVLSNEDLRLLTDPNMVYLIVSLVKNKPELKAYQIVEKKINGVY